MTHSSPSCTIETNLERSFHHFWVLRIPVCCFCGTFDDNWKVLVPAIQWIGWYCVIPRLGGSFLKMKRTRDEGRISTSCKNEFDKLSKKYSPNLPAFEQKNRRNTKNNFVSRSQTFVESGSIVSEESVLIVE